MAGCSALRPDEVNGGACDIVRSWPVRVEYRPGERGSLRLNSGCYSGQLSGLAHALRSSVRHVFGDLRCVPMTDIPADALLRSPQLIRRHATEDDRDALRKIHHAAYHDLIVRIFDPWQEARQDRHFDAAWDRASHDSLYVDGSLVGYCSVEDGDGVVHVHELVIDPAFQGRGIGSALLKEVMAAASDRQLPVHLQTHHNNRAAELYRRLGFVETGHTETNRLFEWTPAGKQPTGGEVRAGAARGPPIPTPQTAMGHSQ